METKVAFIGGLRGLKAIQRHKLEKVLLNLKSKYPDLVILHGDAKGADEIIHNLARLASIPVEIYPRLDDKGFSRANCKGARLEHPGYPGLKKNAAMIMDCNILLAAPPGTDEKEPSGIWNTIKNAMYKKRKVYLITPLGMIWIGAGD